MGTTKHRNLTVDTLTVTGSVTLPEGAFPAPAVVEAIPAAPHVPVLPQKTTVAELRDRVEYLTEVLVHAGLIEATPAPVTAPTPLEAYTPGHAAAEAVAVTPQAVAAGVVDAG